MPETMYEHSYSGPTPTKFYESPLNAAAVASGILPPVEQRLPVAADILVVPPADEIGVYGGSWKNTLQGWLMDHAQYGTGRFIHSTGKGTLEPYWGKDIQVSDDGRVWTYTLRDGVKWPDGEPHVMEDYRFAWEDLNFNKEFQPNVSGKYKDPITGETVKFAVIDDLTWTLTFTSPYYSLHESNSNSYGTRCVTWNMYCPAHYGKQFHPKYTSADAIAAQIEEVGIDPGVENPWAVLFRRYHSLFDYEGAGQPWSGSFTCATLIVPTGCEGHGAAAILKENANPFWIAVDPLGNQLPYVDSMTALNVENRDVAVFRAMAGESDWNAKEYQASDIPLLIQNMEKGDYSVYNWPSMSGHESGLGMNVTWNKDPELGRMFRTKDFRIALSYGIDREAINETAYLGLGTARNAVVHPSHPYNPGLEYETLDATYDIAKANSMLDALGYTDTDGDGIRNRKGDLDGNSGNIELFYEVMEGGHAQDKYVPSAIQLVADYALMGITMTWSQSEQAHLNSYWPTEEGYFPGWASGPRQNEWGGSAGVHPSEVHSVIGPAIGANVASDGAEGMQQVADASFLPIAADGTWAADTAGDYKSMKATRDAGFDYTVNHPERIRLAKEMLAVSVTEKYHIGIVGFAPSSVGVKRNNFRNVPKGHEPQRVGFRTEMYYFEDGIDNLSNPGNKSRAYKSESFLTGFTPTSEK
jgi:peptide/nickel transport system substrate-binding protein